MHGSSFVIPVKQFTILTQIWKEKIEPVIMPNASGGKGMSGKSVENNFQEMYNEIIVFDQRK